MKFGVRECCDVVLRAKAAQKIGNKIFYKNEPVCYFDTLKTSTLEGAATTVYAQGGRGNARLMSWDGERTVTFTMEDALISPIGLAILTGAGLIEATNDKPIIQHITETVSRSSGKATGGDATNGSFEDFSLELAYEPYIPVDGKDLNIYVMALDSHGEVVSEPYLFKAVASGTTSAIKEDIAISAVGDIPSDIGESQTDYVFVNCDFDKYTYHTGDDQPTYYKVTANGFGTLNKITLDSTPLDNGAVYWIPDADAIGTIKYIVDMDDSTTVTALIAAGIPVYLHKETTITSAGKQVMLATDFPYNVDTQTETYLGANRDRSDKNKSFIGADSYLVDYYTARHSGAFQIDITPDKFGGSFYLEASTLWRDQGTGQDLPAEFIIPNCRVQSNFTFTMASSGDPSSFTFTMDAFPDYTRYDHEEKVLARIQVIGATEEGLADVLRTETWSGDIVDAEGRIRKPEP